MQSISTRSRLSEMPRQYSICWRSSSTSKPDFQSSSPHVDRECRLSWPKFYSSPGYLVSRPLQDHQTFGTKGKRSSLGGGLLKKTKPCPCSSLFTYFVIVTSYKIAIGPAIKYLAETKSRFWLSKSLAP